MTDVDDVTNSGFDNMRRENNNLQASIEDESIDFSSLKADSNVQDEIAKHNSNFDRINEVNNVVLRETNSSHQNLYASAEEFVGPEITANQLEGTITDSQKNHLSDNQVQQISQNTFEDSDAEMDITQAEQYVYTSSDGSDNFDAGNGSWLDRVHLDGINQGPSQNLTGEGSWVLVVDDDTAFAMTDHGIEFDAAASGTISLWDGSELDFSNIEKIEWEQF